MNTQVIAQTDAGPKGGKDTKDTARSQTTWRSVADLPFEAQEALYQFREEEAQTRASKGDDKAATDAEKAKQAERDAMTIELGTRTSYKSEGKGSATVVTSTRAKALTFDHYAPTQRFLELLRASPRTDPVALWTRAITEDPNVGGEVATINQGKNRTTGKRYALIIANGGYTKDAVRVDEATRSMVTWPKLTGAPKDGAAMKATYEGRGYQALLLENQTAAAMATIVSLYQKRMRPGDELMFSYHGHGYEHGAVGINGKYLHWGTLHQLAAAAVSSGWNCTIVADCCHSGRLQHLIADEQDYEEVASETTVQSGKEAGASSDSKVRARIRSAEDELANYKTSGPQQNHLAAVERLLASIGTVNAAQLEEEFDNVYDMIIAAGKAQFSPQKSSRTRVREACKLLYNHRKDAAFEPYRARYTTMLESSYAARKHCDRMDKEGAARKAKIKASLAR